MEISKEIRKKYKKACINCFYLARESAGINSLNPEERLKIHDGSFEKHERMNYLCRKGFFDTGYRNANNADLIKLWTKKRKSTECSFFKYEHMLLFSGAENNTQLKANILTKRISIISICISVFSLIVAVFSLLCS